MEVTNNMNTALSGRPNFICTKIYKHYPLDDILTLEKLRVRLACI